MSQLPAKSRVFVALAPANEWEKSDVFLNDIRNALNTISWQISGDKKSKPPEPWMPEFMREKKKDPAKPKESVAMEVDDIKAFLAKPRVSDKVKTNE